MPSLLDASPAAAVDLPRMERWTSWVARLMGDAAVRASADDRRTLAGAAADADDLRRRLAAAQAGWCDELDQAALLAVYDLWDANHDRHARRAAAVDPDGFREWSRRSAGVRPDRP